MNPNKGAGGGTEPPPAQAERHFAYQQTGLPVVTLTERQILDFYYPWWSGEMLRIGRSPMITEANCIDDYCMAQMAWEVE